MTRRVKIVQAKTHPSAPVAARPAFWHRLWVTERQLATVLVT